MVHGEHSLRQSEFHRRRWLLTLEQRPQAANRFAGTDNKEPRTKEPQGNESMRQRDKMLSSKVPMAIENETGARREQEQL